jgi:sulfonate transport system substrate-binding protein
MKKKMKKFLSIILTATLLVSVATACGSNSTADSGAASTPAGESNAQTASNAQAAPDTQAANNAQIELKPLRFGFPGTGAWPNTILGPAYEYGYLDEYLNELGYKAELVGFPGAAPAIHEALVAKELDYVVYAGMAGDLSKANGIDHTLISITSWSSFWAVVVATDSGIETPEDLRGKKIAYARGASPHMYLIRVLREAGLSFDDIEAINASSTEGLAGMATGSIDGTIVQHGQAAELVAEGTAKVIHVGYEADKSVYYEPTVLIGRTELYNENKDVAVAIQKAFLKARDKGKEDVDAYYQLMAEKSGLGFETVKATAEYDLDVGVPLSLDEQYINSLKDILAFLQDNELTAGDIDFDAWIDGGYVVKRAAEEYANEK